MKRLLYAFLCIGAITFLPILLLAQPTANFSATPTMGCSPIVVQFTDLSTGSPTSWQWNLGNGTNSTLQNPSTTYINSGTYTVTLTVTNAGGSNTKTITNYITVLQTPTVNFSANATTVCVPGTVSFTNLSTPGGTGTPSYYWDFGDGTNSTATNPTHTYSNVGQYNVTLEVTNGNGCSQSLTMSQYINVVAIPTASFSANNNSFCSAPATVSFSNSSSGATSYMWYFGDGSTSTSSNPSHTYNTSGSYTVMLVAKNAAGCSDTLTMPSYIVIGNSQASFSGPTSACVGTSVSFTNNSTPTGGSSVWYFGDGGSVNSNNALHTYGSAGTYTVMLVYNINGCSDTAKQSLTVNNLPTVSSSVSSYYNCKTPFTVNFSNSSSGATSYLWNFGDGSTSTLTNPSHTYNTLGVYSVLLTATNSSGCSASTTLPSPYYIVIGPATGTITASPPTGCAPQSVSFSTNITNGYVSLNPTGANINFGDGSSANIVSGSHTYTNPGTYNVVYTFTVTGGCVYTASTTVTLVSPPIPNFSANPTTVCVGQNVSFTNSSTGATSYTWLFGDGGTSSLTNPTHAYGAPGTYTVMLIAANSYCSDTVVMPNLITVNPPLAVFSGAITNCSNRFAFTFTNTSIGATSDSWDFGDGSTSTSTASTVTHTYSAYGTYTVTLTVANSSTGCTNNKTMVVAVFPMVDTFNANHVTTCKGNSITFTGTVNTSGYYTNYNWNFGDGSSTNSTTNTKSHSYTTPGIYTVRLIITDIWGCTDTLTKTNYIQVGGPTVSYVASPTTGCPGLVVGFTNTSNGNGFTPLTYAWSFGDGGTSTITNPSHTYNTVGNFTSQLTATDILGCTGTASVAISVAVPTAQFTANDTAICFNGSVSFNNTSTGAVSYSWNFGDGGTSTSVSPTHTYTTSGYYTVTLIATNSYGCTNTMTRTAYIHVETFPVSFTLSDTLSNCPPLSVSVVSTSPSAIATYAWTFGNGAQAVSSNPSTLYTYPGNYTVKLIATNSIGCVDSATQAVTIHGPTGTLSYSSVSGCLPVTVTLTATSQNATAITWDMNNGYTQTTSGQNSFTYTYTSPGLFVPLIVLSNGSCQVPIEGTDSIKVDGIYVDFTHTPSSICQSGTVNFYDTTYSPLSNITSWSWNFGDGGTATTHDPTHNYTAAGTYTVTLVVSNTTGCHDTATHIVTIHGHPVVTAGTAQTICRGQATGVTLSASGAATYAWSPGTGLSCTACTNPVALPTVTTTYMVTGTDSFGCSATASVTITVAPLPTVTATANPPAICSGTSTTISGGGATSYVWSPATGLSCTNCQSTTANPTTTTTYIVTGSNGTCSNTATVTVTINPLPNISGGSNVAICLNTSTTLQASGGDSYVWSPGTGLSCTNCANPTASPTVTTSYTVTGTDSNGCPNTALVTVTVNPLPTVTVTPPQTLCQGQTTPVQLNASGASTYAWSPATGLSCTNCSNPTALPTTTTTYSVTGTDVNGCSNTASVLLQVLPLPTVTATANPPAICSGTSTTISGGGATSYVWSPATGLSCTNCQSTTANPTTTTTYIVTGSNGTCSNTATVTVTINPLPNISGGSNVAICLNTSTTLQASGGDSYVWSPGTGLSCTNCANPTASPTVTTSYTVTGTDSNGCPNTALVTVTVNPLPTVTVTPPQTLCQGQTTPVQLNASGASSYAWSPATGLSCTNCSNPTALPTTTTTYSVTGTDVNGCSNTASVLLQVLPLPTVTATANPPAICSGTSTTISGGGATSYVWSPATGLSCTNCQSTTANPTTTTTYIVTGSNGTCSNTATVTVTINPLPNISGGSNVAICLNTSTTLQASGGDSYVWSPGTGLSCTNCANPTASPTVTTSYTVTGTDSNGCPNTALVTVTVNPLPTVTVTPPQTLCQGQTTPVQLNASGASSYAWSPATGLSCTNCSNPTALPTTTTTYSVTGTDVNGCSNTASVLLQVLPLPTVTATANPPAICSGTSTTISGGGATSYVWSPATGLSCTNCQSTTANPTTTTTYIVTGSNGTCSNTATVTVTINPLPNISGGSNVAICLNTSTTLQASGGDSYVWSPGTGLSCTNCANPTASPTVTTSYTVTGTDSNGCPNTALVTVTVNPLPTVTVTPPQTLCQGQTTPVQLNASGASSYAWSPATGLSCTNCSNPTALPTTTTTYSVTGTDVNGCSNTASVLLQVLPLPTVTATANPPAICSGTSTTISGGGATSYVWSPATGLSCTNCQSTTANPTTTTTYIVTGSNGTCSNTATVTVTINPLPNISGGSNVAICLNTSTTLQASGGDSYVWSPGTGLSCTNCANPTASPTVTTSYTVTGTDSNGCPNTALVTVTVNPLPTVTVTPPQTLCQGQTTPVQLNASGASTYAWSPATGLSCTNCSNPTALPTTTTTYSVTGTDVNGCSNTASVLLQVLPLPTVTATANPPAICSGTSTTISGGGATSYVWSPATGLSCTNCQSTTANPTTTTTYIVTGSNGTCSNTATVTVTINPLPNISGGSNVAICLNTSTTLQASGGDSYVWSPGTGLSCTNCANPTASPTVTTSYTVTGTDSNGCPNTALVTVTVNPLPTVTVTPPQTLCQGQTTPVQLNASGASSYAWSPATGLSCTNCSNPTALPTTTTTYSVTGTDVNGCSNTASVLLQVLPLPTVTATANPPAICSGTSTTISGGGATSYVWSPATGLSCTNCQSTTANPTTTTTYIVTGSNGTCSNTATVTVTINPLPNISGGSNVAICLNTSTTLQASGGDSYVWSPGTGLSCTNCANPTASPTVTTSYTVTGTDSNGCPNTALVTVTVNPLPTVTVTPPQTLCQGQTTPVQLNASGASTYAWSPATGLSCTNCSNPTALPTTTTTYSVTGTDVNGCSNTASVLLQVLPLPTVTATANPPAICSGTSTTISGGGATSYVWSPATGLSCTNCQSTTANPTTTTTYIVTGSNGTCSNTATVTVTINPLPNISGGSNVAICLNTSTTLQASGGDSYVWSPGTGLSCTNCANPTASPTVTTSYTVTGTDSNGCPNTALVTVTVNPLPTVTVTPPQTLCQGQTTPVQLNASGASSYAWSPATGLSCTNCSNPTALPTTTTTYSVTGTDVNGCSNTASVLLQVLPLPTVTATANPPAICSGTSTTISGGGATSYVWSPATGLSCTNCQSTTANPTTTTTYIVTGSNGTCSNTATVTVTINPLPNISGGSNVAICLNTSTTLQASGGDSYVWSPGTGLSCTNCANPTASPTVTTSYTVTGTDSNGCPNTALVTVTVNPLPTVTVTPPQTLCQGQTTPVQLNASGASTYAWSPATGLSCTNCSNPTALPTTTTTYSVTGTDVNGCSNTASVLLQVLPLPTVTATANPPAICSGTSTTISGGGATSYVWSPATGLSCTNCQSTTANPTTTTTYIVTGSNGTCSNTATVTVTINPLPNISGGSNVAICLNTSTTLQASGGDSYVWSPGTGLSCTNCANPTASPTVTTSYTVTGTDSNGCPNTALVTVTVNPLPTVTVTPPQTLCQGQTTPVQLNASGASSYAWSPATGLSCTNCSNPTALPTTTTTYSVTGTDVNGCSNTASVLLQVLPLPTVTATANPPAICSGTSTTISGGGATSYVWSPATGLSCTNCQSTTANPTTTTTYIVTGSNGTCSNTATVTVTINPLPNISGGSNVAICLNTSTTLQASGGDSYVWSPGTGLSCTNCANPTASPTVTTSYTVTGTDSNGCPNTALVTVTVNPLPTVTVTPPQTLCQGQTTPVQLNASGASSYAWSPATGLSCTNCSNPTALPTTTTTYSVTGTDVNGCSNTASVLLQVLPLPTVTATANPPAICSGTSTTISGGGATSYVWSPATGLSCTNCQSTTANPTTTTTYIVTGSNGTCSNTATVTVTINPLPNISGGSNVAICLNTSTTLQASGGDSYVWSPGTGLSCTNCANPTASPTVTTSYTVTGTDSNGCPNTALVTVTVNPLPTVTVTPPQTLCQGQTTPVQLNASGASTYAWSPATGLSCTNCSNPTALPTTTTTYSVTGTDVNGCSNTASVLLQVLPLPTVTATANPPAICSGTSTTISGGGATSYVWSPATGLSCTNCQSTTANPTTTTTYIVTGSNGTCSNTATVTVTINPLPNISGGSNVAICLNTSTTLQASGGDSYVWSPGTGLSCTNCANPTASPTVTTSYTVTGTDSNGCPNTALVTVTVNPLPTVTVTPPQTLCQGQTTPVQLNASGASSYAWSPATGLSCTNCSNPTALPTTTTTYSVTGTDVNGCSNTASVLLQVLPLPTVTATANPPAICSGTSTTISGGGATSYVWSPATGLSCTNCQSTTANPTTTTTYIVTGSNGTCSNTATVTVTINPLPNISGGSNVAICLNTSTTLQASGGDSYVWSPGTGLSCTNCANPTASPTVTTSYTVTGTDSNGCPNTALVTVTVNPLPTVTVTPPQTLCQGQTTPVQLNASGASTYAWSPATGLSCTNCSNPTALPTTTTTYSVTGTDVNGCSNTASVLLQVLPLPTVTATANPPAICSGTSTTISGGGATSYVWSPATGLSCTNCQSTTANPTTTTTYIVTGSNGTCSNTATVTVTINPLPNISGGSNVAICLNTSTTLQASGGDSYVWSPGTGLSCTNCANPTASPTVTTSYTVTGTDSNGCPNTALVTVTVNPLPTVTVTPPQTLCQGQTTPVQLNASGASSYAWSPATGLSCTNCSNPTALPTTTTTYSVTGTDVNGCSNTASVLLQVLPLPTVTATANPPAICSGTSTTISGGGATSYVWSPATGLSCTNCQSTTANPTTTTTYIVTGSNGTCSNTATVTVTINPLPTVNAGPDTVVCLGSSVQLQATGTVNYTWSPTAGLSCTACPNPLAAPTVTTQYIVTGTDANGCSKKDTVNITIRQLPVVTAANQAVCPGGSANLLASGAASYIWLPGASLSCTACPNPVSTPTATTTYTITGTDGFGCVNTGTVTVSINPLPDVSATTTNPKICIGSTTQLQAGGANNYIWSPATGLSCTNCANPIASPSLTTTYTLTGINGTNCSSTATITITVNPLPAVYAGIDTGICAGLSTQLQATGANTYIWSPAGSLSCTNCTDPLADPTATTQYIVTGTDTNSCVNHDTVNVAVYALPVIAAANHTVCIGAAVQLLATGASTYAWSPATGLSCSNCANPSANPTITTTYTISGINVHGCVDTSHVTVTVNPLPVIGVDTAQVICNGTSVQLHATGANTYAWSPATGLSCNNCASPLASPSDTTTYLVTGTDNNGCADTNSVTVNVLPKPIVSAGQDKSICKGNAVQLQATGANTYVWSPSTGLSCTNCDTTTANPVAPVTYTVIGTGADGCLDTSHVTVNIYTQPVISADGEQTICNGASDTLTGTGGQNYTWSPATGLSCTNCHITIASPTVSTTYMITGTDANGCMDSGRIVITVIQPVATSVGKNDTICVGQSAQLSANGGTGFLWLPSQSLDNNTYDAPVATPDTTTQYSVYITENECFTDTSYVTVVVNDNPTVTLGPDMKIIAGSSVPLVPQTTGSINSYAWSPAATLSCDNCQSPMATPSATTTYTVVVSTNAGCQASAKITLDLGCDKSQVFIPNTFTPNGDGVNDRFFVSGKGITIIKQFSVYDRWGELLYEAENIPINDPQYGWDGTYKGAKLNPDVYVYIISATCEAGDLLRFKGDISIVR